MLSISIQAGGQSRRMGSDKALIQLSRKALIEHVLDRVAGLGDEVFITSNHPEALTYLGIRLVPDLVPGAGALAGLLTALKAAQGNKVLVLACDMPFVNRRLLQHMISQSKGKDVVVPRYAGYLEPMHAIYDKRCLPAIEDSLHGGHTRVVSFYKQVDVLTIDEQEIMKYDPFGRSFFNINTPDDLALAEDTIQRLSNSNTSAATAR